MAGDYTVVVDTGNESYVGAQEKTYRQAKLAARKLLDQIPEKGYVCIVTPIPNSRRIYAEKHCWELESEGKISSLYRCTRCGDTGLESAKEKLEEDGCFLEEQACSKCTPLFWVPVCDNACRSCGTVPGDGERSKYTYCYQCSKRDNICRGCGNSLAQN